MRQCKKSYNKQYVCVITHRPVLIMCLWTSCLGLLPLVQLIGRGVNLFMEGRTQVQDRPTVLW